MNSKRGLLSLLLNLFVLFLSLSSKAQLLDGSTLSPVSTQKIIDRIQPGSILIIGEMHGLGPVQKQQLELLEALKNKGLKISIGFEFFNFTDQLAINNYRSKLISRDEFLTAIKWTGFNFDFYQNQLLFPDAQKGENSLGLNVPSFVTKQLSLGGYNSLSPEQKSLLPADFTLGNEGYKVRFAEAMGGHISTDKLDLFFSAQSAWDDTIAYHALDYIQNHPLDVFVVIIGEFHVAYGGGLPDRLKQRLTQKGLQNDITTVSQIYTDGMTADDIHDEIQPSNLYGSRSDFIWLSEPVSNP